MSRFKTAAIAPSFHNGIVFKRKGSRVRYIDPATAKVSPWVRVHKAFGIAAESPVIEAVEATSLPVVPDMAAHYQRQTVAELRTLAGNLGIKVPSKARKADIISALTN